VTGDSPSKAALEDCHSLRKTFYYGATKSRRRSSCLGKVAKGVKCSVVGCKEDAVRSISLEEISRAGLKASASGRGYLCKNHYKEMKKKLKKDKQIEQWRIKR